MRILYIHQHFATPSGSTGTRSYEFARRWVKRGHEVTILTGNYDISGLRPSRRLLTTHRVEGANVKVLGVPYSNTQGSSRRMLSFLTFLLLSSVYALFVKKPDIVFATSTPLTVAIPALLLKWTRGVPYAFEVRDQWPAVPIAMGHLRNPLIRWIARRVERQAYRDAELTVALSPGMAEGVRSVCDQASRLLVVPNSSDLATFMPTENKGDLVDLVNSTTATVVIHFGAVSRANGLDFLLRVADLTRDYDIHFLVIGSGQELSALVAKRDKMNLSKITFVGPVPKERLATIVPKADVSAVIFAPIPILAHNSANKFFDSLAAGLPILLNYEGWQGELLRSATAGLSSPMGDVESFVTNLLALHHDPGMRKRLGANARQLAETRFSRDQLADTVVTALEDSVQRAEISSGDS